MGKGAALSSYTGRHRRPSNTGPKLAATSVTAAVVVGDVFTSGAAYAADATDFARLRRCESGGNYRINTGNGYYGAYQFDLRTWRGLGYGGLPSNAAPAIQDEAARRLQAARGWGPWPGYARKLGLRRGSSTGTTTTGTRKVFRDAQTRVPEVTIELLPKGTVLTPPLAPEVILSVEYKDVFRKDVRAWQLQMARRGWDITVDGHFGPESQRVAAAFEAEKGIVTLLPGHVGYEQWNEAWASPVT